MNEHDLSETVCGCTYCNATIKYVERRNVPVWHENGKTYVTAYFCKDCYRKAAAKLLNISSDESKQKALQDYSEMLQEINIKCIGDGIDEWLVKLVDEMIKINKLPEGEREQAFKIFSIDMEQHDPAEAVCICTYCHSIVKYLQRKVVPIWRDDCKSFFTAYSCDDCWS